MLSYVLQVTSSLLDTDVLQLFDERPTAFHLMQREGRTPMSLEGYFGWAYECLRCHERH